MVMNDAKTANARDRRSSLTAPLQHGIFRRIWLASLLSNLGLMILGVGAAWSMAGITSSAGMVGLVQSALQLPVALVAAPAGAAADMFDRRKLALYSLGFSFAGSAVLVALAGFGAIGPETLLVSCFTIGCGMALFGPSWQSSVNEQVPANSVAPAIALNGISFNIARSFGPAIGGAIIAAAGAAAAFAANALSYLPLIAVLLLWRRVAEPSRLPPERLAGAVVAGARYIANSPPVRIALLRTLSSGSPAAASQR